nr:NADPH-dependent F420 reductase [Micromonospora purpureochromogenes]
MIGAGRKITDCAAGADRSLAIQTIASDAIDNEGFLHGTIRAPRRPNNQARRWGMPTSTPELATDMTTVGLIGSGNIGGTVARLAVAAGHDVVLSNSRGPETLKDLVAELGPRARAATPAEAAAAGDLVVVTIPLRAYREVPAAPLAGKTVIDTDNYYPERDGHFPELDDESTTTSELLQAHLPESRVVKAFNNIYFAHLHALARPAGAADRSALPIAGDDTGAKAAVTAFLDSLGYDAVDVGPLAEGWRFQRDTAAYAGLYSADPADWARPAPRNAEQVRAALAAARRYADS